MTSPLPEGEGQGEGPGQTTGGAVHRSPGQARPLYPPPGEPKPEWARDLPDTTADGEHVVYGSRPLAPRVERVEPLDGYALRVTFATGEVRRVDCRPLLDSDVFRRLKDEAEFRCVRPVNGGGGIGWASGADLSRDTTYALGASE